MVRRIYTCSLLLSRAVAIDVNGRWGMWKVLSCCSSTPEHQPPQPYFSVFLSVCWSPTFSHPTPVRGADRKDMFPGRRRVCLICTTSTLGCALWCWFSWQNYLLLVSNVFISLVIYPHHMYIYIYICVARTHKSDCRNRFHE